MARYFPSHTSRLLLQILCFLMSDFPYPSFPLPPPFLSAYLLQYQISILPFPPSFHPWGIFSLPTLSSPAAGLLPSHPLLPIPPDTILSLPYLSSESDFLPIPQAAIPFRFMIISIRVLLPNRHCFHRRAERAQRVSPTELSCPLLVGFPKSFPYFHFS